ncbi:uncharacterized protein LOC111919003 [Lactuca sativa]|uniref:Uncharacterized protein n=1 Tax=Lactuca sativa TaxID=4236 RepID=A0A9R1WXW8_LACSA|nr:uncharacterized protein LOC111919003 [Lactuca sativa]KAJ0191254.1 hypothetical protein LSAT_V11C800434830 [Lactuca sativa]
MVEQMVSSNLSKYGLGKCPSIISSSPDKPPTPLVTTKDKTVKNVQNPPPVAAKDTNVKSVQNDSKTGPPETLEAKSPPGGSNVNNHNLVYARRKSDGEHIGDKRRSSPQKGNDVVNEQSSVVNLSAMEHWNTRFVQLQNYLKQCDNSNHEVYLQELRSFSPDECSRHAVDLERRAIQLVVEEGREIQRVKDLNVLGKSTGNHLLLRQSIPIFKSEKLV